MCMKPIPSLGILALGFESGTLVYWNPDAHFGREVKKHSNTITTMFTHELK